VNFDNPFDKTPYSNVFNRISFTPVPWATLQVDSQLPLLDKGFTEVNTSINFKPTASTGIGFSHRYLTGNPFFVDSSLYTVSGYYRIDDNWGVSITEQYEAETKLLEYQRYAVYRDLTSWVASLGAIIRDNNGVKEYGVLLSFTLKAFPSFGLNANFDPAGANQGQ
jgi:LPS-assembly protein